MSKIFKTIVMVYGVGVVLLLGLIFMFIIMFNSNDQSKSNDNTSNNTTSVDVNKLIRPGVTRKEVIDIALSLNGKVKYFWGGRSDAGWNPLWGTFMLVTAPGDWTSGTYQPYGLDCSGFVDWVYKTAGTNAMYGTTANQLVNSYAINESELKPGDLVFRFDTEGSQVNHVGIFVKKENGVKYYAHCQGGTGVIVNSSPTFQYWRRPYIKFEDD